MAIWRPAGSAWGYQTYTISAPLRTHHRRATCEEVQCPAYLYGWITRVNESDPDLGQAQAHYIRRESGRSFTEERQKDGVTAFTFRSGQPCFQRHYTRVEREEIFLRRLGDRRGDPSRSRPYIHTKPEFWVEDFAEHQDKLAVAFNRG